jgi:acyl-coenzyme A synthetase/AMP-(fatty) acid ligase
MPPAWENLSDPIFHHAATAPDRPCIVEGRTVLTYGETATLVAKASAWLHGLGIIEGERVGVHLSSSADHVILAFALLRLGASLTELHYSSAAAPEPKLLEGLAIARLFVEADAPLSGPVPAIRVDPHWRERVARVTGDRRSASKGDALPIVSLSSGSTGLPKGIVTTQRLQFERHRAYAEILEGGGIYKPGRTANFLVTASIAHTTFFRRVLAQFIAGGAVVLLPEYAHPIDLVRAVASWDNAALAATANMCRAFLAAAPEDGLLFPRVRALILVGLPLFSDEKRAMVRRVTPHFYDSYGASGTGTIACLLPHEIEAKAASVGRPVAGMAVEIVDAAGAKRPVGALGPLRCRGATAKAVLSLGAASESEKIAEGWYYPGEIGCFDEDGYLYLKGRAADVIRRNGVEVFPSEVEEALAAHPAVRAVAAVGVPSAARGEEIVAVVVADASAAHAALAQHCRTHLAPEKWPDRVFYAASLPSTPGGKLNRAQIRALVLEEIARKSAP